MRYVQNTPSYNFSDTTTSSKSDSRISQLRALGTYTPSKVFVIHASVGYDCFKIGVHIFFCDLDGA